MNLYEALEAPFVNDEVIETLKLYGYVIDKNTSYELISNPRVILLSLNNDFETTIRHLSFRMLSKDIYFSKEEKEELKDILLANNFIFDNSNWILIFSEPTFLLASLKNDYEQTIEYVRNCEFKSSLNEDEIKEFKQIFIDHDFVYSEDSNKFLKSFSCAFLASLENDGWESLVQYNYNQNMDNNQKDAIFNALRKNMVGYNFYPFKILKDPYMLEKIILNDDELEFIANSLFNERKDYSKEDEIRLLKYLNSNKSSIEEELVSMYEKGLDRYTMNLMQMLSLSFYIKKRLSEFGLSDLKINLFAYFQKNSERLLSGLYRENEIMLGINNYNGSIYSMLATLHHEMFHAIQIRDMKSVRIFNDEDIDIYCKDRVLRDFLGETYYKDNYKYLKEEYDAEFKAMIETVNLFGKEDVLFFELANFVKEELSNEELLLTSKNKVAFEDTSYRTIKGKKYHLDVLFDSLIKGINERIDTIDLDELFYTYPYLKYEYKYEDDTLIKRDMANLVFLLDLTKNETRQKIYLSIIKNRININKCFDALKNKEELAKCLTKQYKQETILSIKKLLETTFSRDEKYQEITDKKR